MVAIAWKSNFPRWRLIEQGRHLGRAGRHFPPIFRQTKFLRQKWQKGVIFGLSPCFLERKELLQRNGKKVNMCWPLLEKVRKMLRKYFPAYV